MTETIVDPKIADASQRVAGIAALRQIRKIVDTEMAQEDKKSRWARRISVVGIVSTIVIVAWSLNAILK